MSRQFKLTEEEIAKLTALSQVSFLFAIGVSSAILILTIVITVISYYQFVMRPKMLIRVTKNLKERMAKYVLKEESLTTFTTLLGTNASIIHAERKKECKDVEDAIDNEIVVKSVDPFKAPSNRYEIGTEKDDELKTCYGMDQDVFAKGAEVNTVNKDKRTKTGTNSDNTPQQSTGGRGEKPLNEPPEEVSLAY